MRKLIIGAVLAVAVASSVAIPAKQGWAWSPVVTAPAAFSWGVIRNIQNVFGFRGNFRGNGSSGGYGSSNNNTAYKDANGVKQRPSR